MPTTQTVLKETIDEEEDDSVNAEEKGFLADEAKDISSLPKSSHQTSPLSTKFWLSAAINTTATAAIIFTNKSIFTTATLRHAQVTFAAIHFATTFILLLLLSRPKIGVFRAKRVDPVRILPLAFGMIFNVVLPNASLAYSSIHFYQIMRVLVTPCVCALNLVSLGQRTPGRAVGALVPVCVGVGWMSWVDTRGGGSGEGGRGTTGLGVVFALAGVVATSLYTVWIKKYHAALACSSMQLLLNQAPVSVLLMLYIIPFADDVTVWREVGAGTYGMIGLSGGLACLITITQFVIIQEAGPVSSTVVGHFKTCLVILLSWVLGRKSFSNQSLVGIGLALGGIISYSIVMHKLPRT